MQQFGFSAKEHENFVLAGPLNTHPRHVSCSRYARSQEPRLGRVWVIRER